MLDLGTGTGTLARGFAKRECHVIAIDPAKRLMQEAKRLDQERQDYPIEAVTW